MFITTAFVVSILCLFFQPTRLLGCLGLLLLFYLHPLLLAVFLVLACIGLFFTYRNQ
jgi:hypothetical protein